MNIGDYFNHMRAGSQIPQMPQMPQMSQQQQPMGYPSQSIDRVAHPYGSLAGDPFRRRPAGMQQQPTPQAAIPVPQEQQQVPQPMFYRQQPPGSLGALMAQYRLSGQF